MNCKPKDRAFVVRDTEGIGCVQNLIGTPVVVDTSFKLAGTDLQAWTIQGPPLRCSGCGRFFVGLLDADLQPIRGDGNVKTEAARIEKPEQVIA